MSIDSAAAHEDEAREWLRRHPGARPRLDLGFSWAREGEPEPHDHVLSAAARCMWPYCHHGHPEGTASTYRPPSFAHILDKIPDEPGQLQDAPESRSP